MRSVAAIFGLALAAVALAPSAWALGQGRDCERILQDYDRTVLFYSSSANVGSVALQPQIAQAAQKAFLAGCVTPDLDMIRLNRLTDEMAGATVVESGAAIRPIALQVGIVGGVTSEVQARTFFSGLGLRVRSQGAPGLGRRIYLGPFQTAGGLASAAALAERAGFIAPYPRRF
jgi:hypothetical protein